MSINKYSLIKGGPLDGMCFIHTKRHLVPLDDKQLKDLTQGDDLVFGEDGVWSLWIYYPPGMIMTNILLPSDSPYALRSDGYGKFSMVEVEKMKALQATCVFNGPLDVCEVIERVAKHSYSQGRLDVARRLVEDYSEFVRDEERG